MADVQLAGITKSFGAHTVIPGLDLEVPELDLLDASGMLAEGHLAALEKLGEAHSGKGEVATASEAWERGASIAREEGNAQAAADFERRIEELSADVAIS